MTHDISEPAPAADGERLNWVGRRLAVRVDAVAHGGHFVARQDGRVVFVRHALPGEAVTVEVTEDGGGSFCRADAVEIHQPSPHRVAPPCEHARPGGCGGCDFQHIDLPEQRALKAAVISEQLARLAGLDRRVTVEALDETGLHWRRRIRYAVTADARLGLRVHRSHEVLALDACPIGAPGVGDATALAARWPGQLEVEVAADDRGSVAVTGYRRDQRRGNQRDRRRPKPAVGALLAGPESLQYRVNGHDFTIGSTGFWQTHPAAAQAFTDAVLAAAAPRAGDRVLDLYAGAGLFTLALAEAVGPTGHVLGLEGDRRAVADAARNLEGHPQASVQAGSVDAGALAAASATLGGADVVVLDPPRTGAGRAVMQALLELPARVIVYVACDPAALARDVRTARDAGWELAGLRAFDAFPMTHHVECVATLRPASRDEPEGS
ncbi:MAG: rRNA methyltransferase [Frankiales bacterium]|nr:rRNA methyltransferase [Frankiales bacterium]